MGESTMAANLLFSVVAYGPRLLHSQALNNWQMTICREQHCKFSGLLSRAYLLQYYALKFER